MCSACSLNSAGHYLPLLVATMPLSSSKGHFHLCNLTVLRKNLLCRVELRKAEQKDFLNFFTHVKSYGSNFAR